MTEQAVFISSIHIGKVRHIENFVIPLSKTERKHLIITGKNGSGKTSLLLEINNYLSELIPALRKPYALVENYSKYNKINNIKINIKLNINLITVDYLFVLFEAKRTISLNIPQGINKVDISKFYNSTDKVNSAFIQYIVNLKAERSFAKDDNNFKVVKEIDNWFTLFELSLKTLFEAPDLQLIFDRKNYNFQIQIGNQEPFSLAQLSDGYSAVISIVTELILRMEATGNKSYDRQGIVLIDEIETHLHVSLQKKIMPFLCNFFPNIQFIVTTHSPFVLSSISNAVICDLETKEVINDLSGYSYTALVESYFDTDKYSTVIKEKLQRFEQLSGQIDLNEDELDEYENLEDYFKSLPKFHAEELEVKLQQIKLKSACCKV